MSTLYILVRPPDGPQQYANEWDGERLRVLATYETVADKIREALRTDDARIFFQIAPGSGGGERRVIGSARVGRIEGSRQSVRVTLDDWQPAADPMPRGRSFGNPWYWTD